SAGQPVAGADQHTNAALSTEGRAPGVKQAPTPGPSSPVTRSRAPGSGQSGYGGVGGASTVEISPKGPIAGGQVRALSLTATGTAHQWVLAKTPGRDCSRPACASLFATTDHGGSWRDVGQLPAPPATSDTARPQSVSQVRITKRNDTTYDGWAFGD